MLTPLGMRFPSGEVWRYDDVKLIISERDDGSLTYENKTIKGPGLTLVFDQGRADPARDYLGRISKKLTKDSNWHFVRWQVITGAAILALMGAFYVLYPYANRALVAVIPDSWAVKAGDVVLDSLYTEYSANQCHSEAGDRALKKMVDRVTPADLPYDLRVQVVQHHQVNALTAPGGRIVLLNGLLQEASSVEEVAGVLAHEAGHVYYKHPLQGMVNILGFSIVGSFFGGDAASIAVVVLSMSYSRDLERQADRKALEYMQENHISAQGFLDFFKRLDDKQKDKTNVAAELQKLISTHPLSEERIDYIGRHIQTEEEGKTFQEILSPQEWRDLKSICENSETKTDNPEEE